MTNKEKYKKAFSVLHASDQIEMEVAQMAQRKHAYMKKVLAASTAVVIVSCSMTAAYAADLGGIRERLTMWFRGEQTPVTATSNGDYSYQYTFTDVDGNPQEFVAGGVTIDDFGNERPASAQEILDDLSDEIVVGDNGRISLYYSMQKKQIDITDLFDSDWICRVAVKDGKQIVYFTIKDNGSGDMDFERTAKEPADAERYTLTE